MTNQARRVSHDDLRQFGTAVLVACGMAPEEAHTVADCLVEADLRGVDSHGVSRLAIYVKRIERGGFDPRGRVEVDRRGAVALVDGGNALGPVVARAAMAAAMDLAAEHGVGIASARNSNHYGMASYVLLEPVSRGLIGLTCSNATPTVAPHGGAAAILGTNPIAYAIPAGRHPPILGDLATSSTAAGRLLVAKARGESIAADLAVDADGRPTTDPAAALAGALLPFGGHKGAALAILVEVLSGALTGAGMLTQLPHFLKNPELPSGYGHFFLALDPARFLDPTEFAARVDWMIDTLTACRPAAGQEGVRMPGERSHRERAERVAHGIPLGPEVLAALDGLAAAKGLPPLLRLGAPG